MANREKILFIADSYSTPLAGTEGQFYKLIGGLKEYEPHLMIFNSSDYIDEHGFPCGVTVLNGLSLLSISTWKNAYSALKKKKEEGYRLAHIFFNDASVVCPPLLKMLGFKVIISRRDMGYWYNAFYLTTLRFNSLFVDAAITNSRAVKSITAEKEWIKTSKVHVIYNGYEDIDQTKSEAIQIEKAAPDVIVIGLVANIRPIKRIQDAILAVAKLVEQNCNVQLSIVGGGDTTALQELAKQKSVDDRVTFLGAQKEPVRYMQSFDIAVLCSQSEGFSNSIIEYMLCQKPVVCSSVGGNPEIVENDINGFLYKVGEVEELTEKLKRLCDSKPLREELGANGEKVVKQKFDMSLMVEAHETLYQQLLG